jgi:hypothetical protein
VTPGIVAEVASLEPEFFLDEEGQTGSHMMIGPDGTGRLYTVILLDLGEDRWLPITGWRSDPPEIEMYREERLRHG